MRDEVEDLRDRVSTLEQILALALQHLKTSGFNRIDFMEEILELAESAHLHGRAAQGQRLRDLFDLMRR
jgi:hypothetical protein